MYERVSKSSRNYVREIEGPHQVQLEATANQISVTQCDIDTFVHGRRSQELADHHLEQREGWRLLDELLIVHLSRVCGVGELEVGAGEWVVGLVPPKMVGAFL